MKKLYDLLTREKDVVESLRLNPEEAEKARTFDLNSFEGFLASYLPVGFVANPKGITEWVDDEKAQGAATHQKGKGRRPVTVDSKDLPLLRATGAYSKEVALLEKEWLSMRAFKHLRDQRKLVPTEFIRSDP
jgi:hypothetical protein